MINSPTVKLGVVAVSRDSFDQSLSARRLGHLMQALKNAGIEAHPCPVIIENDRDSMAAIENLKEAQCNAAVVFLGNFGPEGPTTLFIQKYGGPCMICAAAEENARTLASARNRGDALCGMLNIGYSLHLRRLRAFIPQFPNGSPEPLVAQVRLFERIARVVIGVRQLKLVGFGPRPQDFLACNAPIQPFFDLGIEVVENSELDLYRLFKEAALKTDKLRAAEESMRSELGDRTSYPDLLPKMAQLEVALMDYREQNLGASRFMVFANKCWPSFEFEFGFVPCYINSRLASRGIPVACEVDLYGAVSEFMAQLAGSTPATILDINNSVPADVIPAGADLKGAAFEDLFMGFHCGNTCSDCMKTCEVKYQGIMNRLMEGGRTPDISRGTLEGQIKPGPVTLFRLQSTADCRLRSYMAQGEVLDIAPQSFGGIGIIAIPNFRRFYRHVLIGKGFPHHTAVSFQHAGQALFEAARMLGVDDIGVPLPNTMLYSGENPFEVFQ